MSALAEQWCEACRADSPVVAESKRAELLTELCEWVCEPVAGVDQLVAHFSFEDFVSGLTFVQRVADIAEAENHHPRLVLEWGRVEVSWWTHTIRGLHMNDFILAARTSALYARTGH